MILTVLTWITVFYGSLVATASVEDDFSIEYIPRKSNIFEGKNIEMTIIPNSHLMASAKRTLRRIKSLSPRHQNTQTGVLKAFPAPPANSVKPSTSVEDDFDNESVTSMSVVSQSFLEDLGLRSRPSTPSLHSPSPQSLRRMTSSPSLIFLRQKKKSSESSSDFSSSSYEDEEFEPDNFEERSLVSEHDYNYFNFVDIDAEVTEAVKDNEKAEETEGIIVPQSNEMIIETTKQATEEKEQKFKITDMPSELLTNIIEYCVDSSALAIREVNKKFRDSCDSYLNFLTNLTLKPSKADQLRFDLKYHLSATMMQFYKNQPQVNEILNSALECKKPWTLLSLYDLSVLKPSENSAIFSDEFIKTTILPQLESLPRNNAIEPSPIFLLGEALLKSKRSQLFNEAILPIINRISVEMFTGIPTTDLLSPDFLSLQQDQKVLGATLHTVIGYNLNFTVKHLVKIQPDVVKSKNHKGYTVLLIIIEYLGKYRETVQVDEDYIQEWMENANFDLPKRITIQRNFRENNSFLAIEMFLGILSQISEFYRNPEEAISFLGFNQEYTIIFEIAGGNYYQRSTTLLHELVQTQQYDLIFYLGSHFGDFIEKQMDINPLQMAAEMNDPLLVAILLKFYSRIDVNSLTVSGNTAIGLAVGECMRSLKVLLKDPRADPNLHNSMSPLIKSIEIGNIEAVELLLNHSSIDIHRKSICNSKTLSPLGAAVSRRKWEILELLLRSPKGNYNIDRDSSVMQNLKDAEKALMKFGEKHQNLIKMVRRIILPTIAE